MWMNKIRIKSFGGLKDISLDLEPGFTNLVWENEAGKSTIMAFIKMMFYGKLPGGNDISKNLRKKYLPWDGSKMEGAIEFQIGEDSYRLEKSFGKTAAGDKVHLLKLPSGEEVKLAKDMEIGQQFLKMDLNAFEKTIFIKNSGLIQGSGEKDSVAEKISNLSNGMEEDTSMEEVLKRLLLAKEELVSKSGRSGELVRRKEEEEKLDSERTLLLAAEEEQKRVQALIEENKEKAGQKALLLERLKEASKVQKIKELLELRQEEEAAIKRKEEYFKEKLFISKEQEEHCLALKEEIVKQEAAAKQEGKQIEELKEQQREKLKKKEGAESDFDLEGEIKLQEMVQKQKETLLSIKEQRQKLFEEETRLDLERKEEEKEKEEGDSGIQIRIQEIRKEMEEAKKKEIYCGILFLSFLLIGVISLFFSPLPGGILLALSVLFLFLDLELRGKTSLMRNNMVNLSEEDSANEEEKKRQQEEKRRLYEEKKQEFLRKKQECQKEEEHLSQELEASYHSISFWRVGKEKLDSLKEELQEMSDKIRLLEEKQEKELNGIRKKQEELQSVFALYQVSSVAQLKEEMKQQHSLDEEISEKRLKADTLSSAFFMKHLSCYELRKRLSEAQEYFSSEELNLGKEEREEQQKAVQKEYEILLAERNELYQRCTKPEQNPEDLELQLAKLKRQNQEMQEYYDAVSIAYEAMNETAMELRQSFGPKLNEKTAAYFKKLTGGAYEDVLVQNDYGIVALKKGDISYRSYKYLSQGTIDQAYFALRMALVDIISEEMAGQRLPLFLDDIFMQYDENRTKQGVEFLKEYARNGQVILFTPRVVE